MRKKPIWAAMLSLLCTPAAVSFAQDACMFLPDGHLTTSGIAAGDKFGHAVRVHGTLAAFGMPMSDTPAADAGSVALARLVNGTWTHEARLVPIDIQLGDNAGTSVAVCNDWALVGAPRNSSGLTQSGSAYMFRRVNGQWQQTQKLRATTPAVYDRFGTAVAMNETHAAISTIADNANTYGGAVYIYKLSNGVWGSPQRITAPDIAPQDSFGSALSISDGWLVVGSPADDDRGSNSGAVYVFQLTTSGTWQYRQKLVPSDGAAFHAFGSDVSIDGLEMAVGAPGHDGMGISSGAAYTYLFNGSSWVQAQKLTAWDVGTNAPNSFFGSSVSVEGTNLAVGSIGSPGGSSGSSYYGAAYTFKKSGSGWAPLNRLLASNLSHLFYFGNSVAFAGNQVLVGAPGSNVNVQGGGAVYAYELNCTNSAPVVTITAPANNSSAPLGAYVYFSGTAYDAQQGQMNNALVWESNIQGLIGYGPSFSRNTLVAGTHTITASATDTGNLTGSASVVLTITGGSTNTAPVVTITSPQNGATYAQNASVTFSGTATDAQSGNLSHLLVWTSNLQGQLGTGATFTRSDLVPGWHSITARCTDSGNLTGSASLVINIQPTVTNTPPVVSILSPVNNSSHETGTSILFSGSASDQQQGNISSSLVWKANGVIIGTGASFTRSDIAAGGYQISASVTDAGNLTTTASVNITVVAPTPPPPPSTNDWTAASETMVAGTISSGNYISTHTNNNGYEVLKERSSSGNPSKRYSYLEHKWLVPVQPGGTSATFYVKAYRSSSSDNDNFIFEYSTNNSSWTQMLTVTQTSASSTYQTYTLPGNISGTVYVRVRDSNQTQGNNVLDTLHVDHMYIRTQ